MCPGKLSGRDSFSDFVPEQVSCFLQFRQTLEGILGNQKKRPAVKVEVKEVRAFHIVAEIIPLPGMGTQVGLQYDLLLFEIHGEVIPEGH